jgi:tRNA (guanosine-2'-O-)-methyltransferase
MNFRYGATMEEKPKSKPTLRARAERIKDFRCKNLIVVIENPDDTRNIGTIIRNVNALGAEKAYVITNAKLLPDEWEEMRTKPKLSAISASAIKWSFVKTYQRYDELLGSLGEERFCFGCDVAPHERP